MLTTLLLSVILILLVLLIVMHVTGWPESSRHEPDQFGREFRREIAGLRAESAQILHSVKNELESLFSDGIDEKHDLLIKRIEASIALMQTTPSGVRKRISRKNSDEGRIDDPLPEDCVTGEPGQRSTAGNPLLFERQFMLFPDDEANVCPAVGDVSEAEEYISVPAADFDMDLDPPYDPDARDGTDAKTNR